jgi:L-amino acid N-acyltransferase YncA
MRHPLPIAKSAFPILIRDCTQQDITAVHAIYSAQVLTGTASFEEVPPSIEEMEARRMAVLAHGCPYLVAERAGALVGYAYAASYRTRSAYRFTVENTVYIDPGEARQGSARALMLEVIGRCSRSGFSQMIAVIGDENPPSVAFHTAIGFRVVGRLDKVGFKFGRWLNSTVMQREL